MPLFNEEEYIGTILERVIRAPLPAGLEREIIVVDDGSTDDSAEIVAEMSARYPGLIQLFRFEQNRGKGAAIREAQSRRPAFLAPRKFLGCRGDGEQRK